MAIYATPEPRRGQGRADSCGVDLQIVAGPPRDRDPGDVTFVFWAMQISFVDDAGAGVGGGHFGLQWYVASPGTGFGVLNWGVYDDTIGNYATFRGSVPTDPHVVDIGNPPSWGYPFAYGDWCRFRCFRSPRQDWKADELDAGDRQPKDYRHGDQRPDEIAFRVTVDNLTAGDGPFVFRDVLIKRAATSGPLASPILWTEAAHDALSRGPSARFANLWWDGQDAFPSVLATYAAGTTGTDCWVDADGAICQAGARRRTVEGRTSLPLRRTS
jgi:hypothetical protein